MRSIFAAKSNNSGPNANGFHAKRFETFHTFPAGWFNNLGSVAGRIIPANPQTMSWANINDCERELHEQEKADLRSYQAEPISVFPRKIFDQYFVWKPWAEAAGMKSDFASALTRIQIFDLPEPIAGAEYLAILTEPPPPGNPGMSITNGIEICVEQFLRSLGRSPESKGCFSEDQFIFVEHYERGPKSKDPDTWDFWKRGRIPNAWKAATWKTVRDLIGAYAMEWKEL